VKAASIGAISAGVAVVAFILVFVGVGSNQAEKPTDYQRTLEETVSSESASPFTPEETDYQRELEESVSSESDSPSQPSAPVQPTEENNCDPSYPTLCILPHSPDLDCGDIPDKNFEVLPPDPHGFDGDNDGIGCES
jgi:hypothetical protein